MASSRSLNYIPSKFSRPPSLTMPRRRSSVVPVPFPKSGGGREAFRPSEDRMPGEGDEDYDGVDVDDLRLRRLWPFSRGVKEREKIPERLLGWRWNKFKWVLLCTTSMVMLYSIASLVFCLLTWFNVLEHADIVRVGNRRELAVSTLAASMGILTSLVGWAGLLLNNRSFLAAYNLLLWLTFATLLAPGYLTYKQRTFNLEGKVNAQWSQTLDLSSRLRIQNRLGCCGYYNAFVEATVSNTCYARSVLPACKGKFLEFERMVLGRWYTAAFALVPPHMVAMFAGLLCSNHVTYRYGKGMMPKAYRLNMHTMAIVIDEYANKLVNRYGAGMMRSQTMQTLGGGGESSLMSQIITSVECLSNSPPLTPLSEFGGGPGFNHIASGSGSASASASASGSRSNSNSNETKAATSTNVNVEVSSRSPPANESTSEIQSTQVRDDGVLGATTTHTSTQDLDLELSVVLDSESSNPLSTILLQPTLDQKFLPYFLP